MVLFQKNKIRDIRIILCLFVLVLLGYVWISAYYQLVAARIEAIESGKRDVNNYARTLEEHAIRSLQDVDQLAFFLSDRYNDMGGVLDVTGYLKKTSVLGDFFNQVSISDAQGELVLSNVPFEKRNLADQKYISVHAQAELDQLFIDKPVLNRATNQWSIQMSRRISRPDGGFNGVVAVSVDPGYFIRFYDEINLGSRGVVTLAGADGIIRAHRAGGGSEVGQSIAKGLAFRAAVAGGGAGSIITRSLLDGVDRLFAYRKIKNYPLYVLVGIGMDTVLGVYESRKAQMIRLAGITSGLVLLLSGFVSVMFGLLIRSQQQALDAGAAKSKLLVDLAVQQQALESSSERLDTILQNAGDGIITINDRGEIESFNYAAERFFGYALSEILGHHIQRLAPTLYEKNWHSEHEAVLTATTGVHRDGHSIFLEITASKVTLLGLKKFILVVRDITERHKVERLQQEFVSTVSHELRTPLTSIRGALGLVAGGATGVLPDKAAQLITMAYSNTERLTQLINDLLDVQKVESGVLSLSLTECELPGLIDEAVKVNQGFADRFGVSILQAGVPPLVVLSVDPGRFQQVMANLLSNACKYSPKDGIVTVECRLLGEDRIRIEVKDQGPGIPEAFRERIFQKFAQADASTTKNRGGSGLGLSISKAIILQMGGEIAYSSVVGEGSCFFIELPILS
jgi:PAS domain S-box-containing protein